MITRLKIERFKSLKNVELALGRVNLFVGTNASGKSNFLDALRFLQGVGHGLSLDEILNGKLEGIGNAAWEGIRGGSYTAHFIDRATRSSAGAESPVNFELQMPFRLSDKDLAIEYHLAFSPTTATVHSEYLGLLDEAGRQPIFRAGPVAGWPGLRVETPLMERSFHATDLSYPLLIQYFTRHRNPPSLDRRIVESCLTTLKDMQHLHPSPDVLRLYSAARATKRMGERGENFAGLVHTIIREPKTHEALLSWLKQLTPTELEDVKVLSGALGEPMFALVEQGREYPAPMLSDGTLRFAALAAAFFQPEMPGIMTIEEIENGIHPTRLRLLLELIKTQARASGTQVMATTHSPMVLSWLAEEDFRTAFVCQRDEETGESRIRAFASIPQFKGLAQKHSVGDMFAEGWLETVP
jgi:predicted ATPase